jgi:hypothetical protein
VKGSGGSSAGNCLKAVESQEDLSGADVAMNDVVAAQPFVSWSGLCLRRSQCEESGKVCVPSRAILKPSSSSSSLVNLHIGLPNGLITSQ